MAETEQKTAGKLMGEIQARATPPVYPYKAFAILWGLLVVFSDLQTLLAWHRMVVGVRSIGHVVFNLVVFNAAAFLFAYVLWEKKKWAGIIWVILTSGWGLMIAYGFFRYSFMGQPWVTLLVLPSVAVFFLPLYMAWKSRILRSRDSASRTQ